MRIFKYQLKPVDDQTIAIYDDAQILSVQEQDGLLCLWAMVDVTNPIGERRFLIQGTGHELPTGKPLEHVGTVQIRSFVWHVFEVV